MSARRVVVPAASTGSLTAPWSAPDATPTTAPTVVTAVADATANPRTEIRLTRFPSHIAHGVTSRAQSCPWRWPPSLQSPGGAGPAGLPSPGARVVLRATCGEL